MKYERVLHGLAVALMLSGAVMLVVFDGGAIAFALVAIGLALTVLLAAQRPAH